MAGAFVLCISAPGRRGSRPAFPRQSRVSQATKDVLPNWANNMMLHAFRVGSNTTIPGRRGSWTVVDGLCFCCVSP